MRKVNLQSDNDHYDAFDNFPDDGFSETRRPAKKSKGGVFLFIVFIVVVLLLVFAIKNNIISVPTTNPFFDTSPNDQTNTSTPLNNTTANNMNSEQNNTINNIDTDHDGLTDIQETTVYHTDPNKTDTDGDGLTDYEEIKGWSVILENGTRINVTSDPLLQDTDKDGLNDFQEANNKYLGVFARTNPREKDTDGDGLNDTAEVNGWNVSIDNGSRYMVFSNPMIKDTDKDGLNDTEERNANADPIRSDTDSDGLTDGEEVRGWNITVNNGRPYLVTSDPLRRDTDNDTLNDLEERTASTDPYRADTDNDTLSDAFEVKTGWSVLLKGQTINVKSDPTKTDTDGDGLNDSAEYNGWNVSVVGAPIYHVRSDPTQKDADKDGLNDLEEKNAGTDIGKNDTDNDTLLDGFEVNTGWEITVNHVKNIRVYSNPLIADSDNDTLNDSFEKEILTNASNNDTDGDGLNDKIETEEQYQMENFKESKIVNLKIEKTVEVYIVITADNSRINDESKEVVSSVIAYVKVTNVTQSTPLTGEIKYLEYGIVQQSKNIDNFTFSKYTSPNTYEYTVDLLGKGINKTLLTTRGCWRVVVDARVPDTVGASESEILLQLTYYGKTNPTNADTDDDSLSDGKEVKGWTINVTGCTLYTKSSNPTINDTDVDGFNDSLEFTWGTDPGKKDTDGDRLSDYFECTEWGNNNKNLKGWRNADIIDSEKPNPLKKDIYVEVDWMDGHALTSGAIANIMSAFSSWNIVIHIMNDDMIEHVDKFTNDVRDNLHENGSESWGITPARKGVFHYCVMAHRNATGSTDLSGQGWSGGDLFILYDDLLGSNLLQSSVFMHELGHNFLGEIDSSHQSTSSGDSKPTYHCRNDCVMFYSITGKLYYCSECLNEISRDGLYGPLDI